MNLAPLHSSAHRHQLADGGGADLGHSCLPPACPSRPLPRVDYPTIQVTTLYPRGQAPDAMTSNVTAPLERQFGQMPGLDQMSSTSSGGASVISLRFALDMSMDGPAAGAGRHQRGHHLLPSDLPMPCSTARSTRSDAPVLTLAISSPSLPVIQDQRSGGEPPCAQAYSPGQGAWAWRPLPARAARLPCASRPTPQRWPVWHDAGRCVPPSLQ